MICSGCVVINPPFNQLYCSSPAPTQTWQSLKHANLQILKRSPEKPGDWDFKPGDFQNMHKTRIKMVDFLFQGILYIICAPYCILHTAWIVAISRFCDSLWDLEAISWDLQLIPQTARVARSANKRGANVTTQAPFGDSHGHEHSLVLCHNLHHVIMPWLLKPHWQWNSKNVRKCNLGGI